jgi:hypothetical protein
MQDDVEGRVSLSRRILSIAVASATLITVGAVFHFGVPLVAPTIPPQFTDSSLYRPWAGWTSTYMLIHPLWFGVVFALIYLAIRKPGGKLVGLIGGVRYGVGVFLVGSLPVFLLAFAAFQASAEVIGCWVLQSLCQYVAAGAAVGFVAKGG